MATDHHPLPIYLSDSLSACPPVCLWPSLSVNLCLPLSLSLSPTLNHALTQALNPSLTHSPVRVNLSICLSPSPSPLPLPLPLSLSLSLSKVDFTYISHHRCLPHSQTPRMHPACVLGELLPFAHPEALALEGSFGECSGLLGGSWAVIRVPLRVPLRGSIGILYRYRV